MAAERDALLSRIHEALLADRRVVAAWLAGSFGRGEADEWSDRDLWLVATDAAFAAFVAELPSLYRAVGNPILVQRPIPGNAPPGGFFQLVLFEGALEVDWTVVPLSGARRPAANMLLFARQEIALFERPPQISRDVIQDGLEFFWAMAPIGVKYVARGWTSHAVGIIGMQRDALRTLLRSFAEPKAEMPRLGEAITALDCLEVMQQLWTLVEQLHPRMAALGIEVPREVPAAVRQLAERVTRERRSPRPP